MADTELVTVEAIEDHVVLVTLNRPAKRNAINGTMAALIEDTVQRTEANPDVRVVLLASADPRVFCSGADLSQVGARNTDGPMNTAAGGFAGFVRARRSKPWIAVVEGAAVAGGFEICLACDLIVASEQARFSLPEVTRGFVAGGGGLARLPLVLPRPLALELIATGAPVDATRAHAFGMVNRLTPSGGALEAALELARGISANAPLAVQESLAAAKASAGVPDEQAWEVVEQAMARVRSTDDYAEGPRAFLEKRPPRWTGR